MAKMIDLVVVMALSALVRYPLGPFVGFFYSVAADGMNFGPFKGQSIGKKLLKLRVVSTKQRAPATVRDSLLRNAPVGVATFFAIIPVWGWLISGLVGVPLMIMEVYLMVTAEGGRRLGDVMGDTEVLEVKHDPREEPREFKSY
ncbi:MAG: RDD family protein [Oligoflexia bacterium]|nr:RDD family protein [Oligoflexia bacterium]